MPPNEARAFYERALEHDPAPPEARYNLANLLKDLGDGASDWVRHTPTFLEVVTPPVATDITYDPSTRRARM